jgi:hypothetical protein
MATSNYSWNLPTVGGSEDAWGTQLNANWTDLDTLLGGVTQQEFAILDGATVTTAELNILDGVTATAAEMNILDGVTATTAEINLLDGVTWTLADYNTLTATAAELNVLDGITGIASQVEAEAGTATDKLMTPERTKQAIDELSSTFGTTWTNVTGSRSAGTTYTNNTGKFIQVNVQSSITGFAGVTNAALTATVNGVSFVFAWTYNNADNTVEQGGTAGNFIVPPGATYSVTSTAGISTWHELR